MFHPARPLVRWSNRPEDLDDRGVAHARSAIGFWNADGPETAPGKFVQLGLGENPLSVPLGRSRRKFLGQYSRYRESLLIRCDAVGVGPTSRFGRFVIGQQWFDDGGRHTRILEYLYCFSRQTQAEKATFSVCLQALLRE
jgi:hypothetical protein